MACAIVLTEKLHRKLTAVFSYRRIQKQWTIRYSATNWTKHLSFSVTIKKLTIFKTASQAVTPTVFCFSINQWNSPFLTLLAFKCQQLLILIANRRNKSLGQPDSRHHTATGWKSQFIPQKWWKGCSTFIKCKKLK